MTVLRLLMAQSWMISCIAGLYYSLLKYRQLYHYSLYLLVSNVCCIMCCMGSSLLGSLLIWKQSNPGLVVYSPATCLVQPQRLPSRFWAQPLHLPCAHEPALMPPWVCPIKLKHILCLLSLVHVCAKQFYLKCSPKDRGNSLLGSEMLFSGLGSGLIGEAP